MSDRVLSSACCIAFRQQAWIALLIEWKKSKLNESRTNVNLLFSLLRQATAASCQRVWKTIDRFEMIRIIFYACSARRRGSYFTTLRSVSAAKQNYVPRRKRIVDECATKQAI